MPDEFTVAAHQARITRLVHAFQREIPGPLTVLDAFALFEMSLRSLTLAGAFRSPQAAAMLRALFNEFAKGQAKSARAASRAADALIDKLKHEQGAASACGCAIPGPGPDPDSLARFQRADRCAAAQTWTPRENGVCLCPCHRPAP